MASRRIIRETSQLIIAPFCTVVCRADMIVKKMVGKVIL